MLPVRISSMGYISPVSLTIPIPVAIFSTGSTHRRVKIDENRAGDVFAAAGLSEEGLVRATLADLVDSLLVNSTVGLEAVLEQVPRMIHNAYEYGNGVLRRWWEIKKAVRTYSSQALLPNWAPAWPM